MERERFLQTLEHKDWNPCNNLLHMVHGPGGSKEKGNKEGLYNCIGKVRSVAANKMPGEEYLMGTAESLELQNAHFCSRVSFALEQDFFLLLLLILQSMLVW